jgi:uncharacterized protein (UPF0548 family)
MVYLNIPSIQQTKAFLLAQGQLDITYSPLNGTALSTKIDGYDNDFQRVMIGNGQQVFESAKQNIRDWRMFPSHWTKILPEQAPIVVGETVAMYARFGGLWWRNSCRIIYVIDESTRFGFAYGTLPGHVECGEELFLVEIDTAGDVWYTLKAFSKPRFWMARIGYPIMRLLQAKFRKDSGTAMGPIIP